MSEDKNLDIWEEKLENILEELKSCQNKNSLTSCKSCKEFFDCELRKKYVIAVYESMNKGSGGGFEF
ncbi:hypothetical protein [Arcobacter porcinus]|uniref:Uncharacterized protein n=1 Tax=Arcobacter porcinus TaxID=1935204 RepID=A0A5C2HCS2_9BACT|nr:hypothetical protein [Arcobacter porcinus]OCL82838.1 hypothetical protein AAW29_01226 [Arcobacter porcinus]OCL86607.1 hypothetical protein AAX30_01332 [Arcobacter porcinus]OCL96809.1 hypothetical protein AAX27_00441 [Aliarcobacter thereius]QEP40639.1 hypothetical protein APORC_1037 [Arcobacter porcinus]